MPTECIQDSLDFASLGSRKVTVAFDGGAMTSNAGALLLREVDRAISLSRQAAACSQMAEGRTAPSTALRRSSPSASMASRLATRI
jgi:hypothetical protein